MSIKDRSDYPSGFGPGAIVADVPIAMAHRKVYYVGNHPTLVPGERGASDYNDGSFYKPWLTLDNAPTYVKAGDVVYVRQGHALTITSATTFAPDVASVQYIGMGVGEERPIITFSTATTANIAMNAANVRLSNFIFKCNIASQVAMITTTADGCMIDYCSFREGTATGLNFITVGAADGDSDRVHIKKCDFYMPTAGNGDHAIEVLADMVGLMVEDCDIDGDFDEGGIAIPAGGDAQVNMQILRCNIKNRQTNIPAITISGTGSSGIIQDCLLRTDTLSSALDNGSLATDNVRWADETDQVSSTPILSLVDSVNNPIGSDNNNNAFASTNVVANADGSVLEREEYIQTDMLALPRCLASSAKVLTTGNINMFTITGGPIKVLELVGIVTTVVQAQATSVKITVTTTSPAATVDFSAAAVDLTGAAAGASIRHINTTGILTVVTAGFVNEGNAFATNDTNYLVPAGTMQINNASASNTGAITWYLRYVPLSPACRVV